MLKITKTNKKYKNKFKKDNNDISFEVIDNFLSTYFNIPYNISN